MGTGLNRRPTPPTGDADGVFGPLRRDPVALQYEHDVAACSSYGFGLLPGTYFSLQRRLPGSLTQLCAGRAARPVAITWAVVDATARTRADGCAGAATAGADIVRCAGVAVLARRPVRSSWVGARSGRRIADPGDVALITRRADDRCRTGRARPTAARAGAGAGIAVVAGTAFVRGSRFALPGRGVAEPYRAWSIESTAVILTGAGAAVGSGVTRKAAAGATGGARAVTRAGARGIAIRAGRITPVVLGALGAVGPGVAPVAGAGAEGIAGAVPRASARRLAIPADRIAVVVGVAQLAVCSAKPELQRHSPSERHVPWPEQGEGVLDRTRRRSGGDAMSGRARPPIMAPATPFNAWRRDIPLAIVFANRSNR